jgi:hypothetical protein
MAMSMHWLAEQYPDDIDLGGQTWYETNTKLKTDLQWSCKVGTLVVNIVPGKMAFLQREDKDISDGWQVKYQAKSFPGATFPAKYIVGNMIACRVGLDAPPTFDFILQELQEGEDVEIHIGWLDANGNRNGGHSLGVRGALRHGNKMYIWTTDDGDQEGGPPQTVQQRCARPKPDDDTPAQDGGLRDAHLSQVVLDGAGQMHLLGLEANNRVELVTSESPPRPNQPPCCPWDCDGDGTVGIVDLLDLLGGWGAPGACDFDGDGAIGITDLLKMLANWGPCP